MMAEEDTLESVMFVLDLGEIIKAWAFETAGLKATNETVAALIVRLKAER